MKLSSCQKFTPKLCSKVFNRDVKNFCTLFLTFMQGKLMLGKLDFQQKWRMLNSDENKILSEYLNSLQRLT